MIRFSREAGVYAMVLDGEVKYVGQTKNEFRRRMYFYSKPGPTQQTNIRIDELLRKVLSTSPTRKCEVWFLPDARVERGEFHIRIGIGEVKGKPDQMIVERVLIEKLDPEWNRK